jgi:ribosomal protein L11 methyltransferase
MNWIEVSLDVDGEAAEAVADVLRRYGHQGVAIEQAGFPIEVWPDEIPPADRLIVRAYFPEDDEAETKKEPVFSIVNDEDWAEAWKKHYHPLRLGHRLYIRPAWSDAPDARPDDVILVMDPGMAFGTGTHPTTQLCLIAIEEMLADWRAVDVIDMGCGSGILGIAALRLGASKVLGLDIDDLAIKSTMENAELNGVQDQIIVQQGSLDTLKTTARHFDLLLCNILAKAIIEMCTDGLGDVLRAGGQAVFSGIILDQADDVEAALRQTGLDPYRRRTQGDWVVIEARKAGS